MTVSTTRALSDYRKAYAKWLKHDGLNGGGGAYDRKEHKYLRAQEPQPSEFGIEGFAVKLTEQIKASALAEHRRLNPEK